MRRINDSIEKQNIIIKWIKEKMKKKQIQFKLIYQMTKDGNKSEKFHEKCDNKGPTLILIETTKNKIFGGYTPLNWEKGKNVYDTENQTFIFSLNLMKKFDLINKNIYAIRGGEGPWFGDCDFGLHYNMIEGESYANQTCNFLSNNNLELTGGKGNNENFETKQFEVFSVIFD